MSWTSAAARMGWALLILAVTLELATVYGNVLRGARPGRGLRRPAGPERRGVPRSARLPGRRRCSRPSWRRPTASTCARSSRSAGGAGSPTHFLQALDHARTPTARSSCTARRTDNPDQRIAEDVRELRRERARALALAALGRRRRWSPSAASSGGCRAAGRSSIDGTTSTIPGLMMWVAILYALIATWLTHLRRPAARRRSSSTSCASRPTSATAWCASAITSRRSRSRAAKPSSGAARSSASSTSIENWWQLIRRAAKPDAAHHRHRPGERARSAAGGGAGVLRRPPDARQRHPDAASPTARCRARSPGS